MKNQFKFKINNEINSSISFIQEIATAISEYNENDIFIVDQFFKNKIKLNAKSNIFYLKSSELTKSYETLKQVLESIYKKEINLSKSTRIIVVGGGVLTDFGGFLSSILFRGLELHLFPSTWLSAIDSSHGGKNGINFNQIKNQIGTFYFPRKIYLAKNILLLQPRIRIQDAMGELIKIALIDSKNFWNKIEEIPLPKINENVFFECLEHAIKAKYKIVKKDPFEKKGIRFLLNLGHTVGHAIESELKWPHGTTVFYGLIFDLIWSKRRGLINSTNFQSIINSKVIKSIYTSEKMKLFLSLEPKKLERLMNKDKKKVGKKINYVFIEKPGRCVVKQVSINDIVSEYKKQSYEISKTEF